MNSTVNGSSGSWSCLNFSALKIGGTVTYCLIIIVSLVANSLIVIIVCKTPNLKKPINYFIANMALSDLLWPIFVIPLSLSDLHTNYLFLIGGQLGQALCKLLPCFGSVSIVVSTQNLILIAVDRFGAVVQCFHGLVCTEMEESIRRILVLCQFPTSLQHSVYLHPCAAVSHSLLHHLYQAQHTGTPR